MNVPDSVESGGGDTPDSYTGMSYHMTRFAKFKKHQADKLAGKTNKIPSELETPGHMAGQNQKKIPKPAQRSRHAKSKPMNIGGESATVGYVGMSPHLARLAKFNQWHTVGHPGQPKKHGHHGHRHHGAAASGQVPPRPGQKPVSGPEAAAMGFKVGSPPVQQETEPSNLHPEASHEDESIRAEAVRAIKVAAPVARSRRAKAVPIGGATNSPQIGSPLDPEQVAFSPHMARMAKYQEWRNRKPAK